MKGEYNTQVCLDEQACDQMNTSEITNALKSAQNKVIWMCSIGLGLNKSTAK